MKLAPSKKPPSLPLPSAVGVLNSVGRPETRAWLLEGVDVCALRLVAVGCRLQTAYPSNNFRLSVLSRHTVLRQSLSVPVGKHNTAALL